MKFGLVHRVLIDALAALGVLALAASGILAPQTVATLLVLFAIAIAIPDRWRATRACAIGGTIAPMVIVTALAIAVVGAGHSIVAALVEALAGVILARVATRRGAEQDTTLVVAVLVGFAAASLLGGGVLCGLCILGSCLVVPGALVLSLLRREVEGNYRQGARDRSGLPVDVGRILRSRRVVDRGFLGALVLGGAPLAVVVGLFFVMMPRPTPIVMIGLDGIDLSRAASDPSDAVALRFEVEGSDKPPRMPLRLRGSVLDTYDRGTWRRSESAALELDLPKRAAPGGHWITIDRERMHPAVVFIPPRTAAIAAPFAIERLSGGELRGPTEESRYDVFVTDDRTLAKEPLPDPARYLALPPIAPRVRDLGRAWTRGEPSPAPALERHLKSDFTYDLFSPSRGETNALEHFLFESRRGHCELFATAMAVMLRDQGIPARVVIGFFGGTYNGYGGYYVVREREAHAWVEAYVGGAWTTFDPTPSGPAPPLATGPIATARDIADASAHRFARDVLRFGPTEQGKVFAALPRLRWVVLGIAIVLAVVVVVRRRSRTPASTSDEPAPRPPVADLYEDLDDALHAIGIGRDPALPPLAHAEALAGQNHPLASEILALTTVYLEVRFGGAALDRDARRAFARRVDGVRLWRARALP